MFLTILYVSNLGFADTNLFQWKFDGFNVTTSSNSIVFVDNILMTVQSLLSVNEFDTVESSVFLKPTKSNLYSASGTIMKTVFVLDILGEKVISASPKAA